MNTVGVLLSSYNGEKYISQQIDSILNQKNIELKLLVRDDGSTDKTLGILTDYSSQGFLDFYVGDVLEYVDVHDKIGKSFFDLCKKSSTCDYYAFSDQDDYWEPEKLAAAVSVLENCGKSETPLLYCSYAKPVDINLNQIAHKPPKIKSRYIKYDRILMNSILTGCTFVFNNAAKEMLLKYDGANIGIHDWFLAKIVALTGEIIYDKNSYIKYRQHGNNVLGSKENSFGQKLSRNFNNENRCLRSSAAKELLDKYTDVLDNAKCVALDTLANYQKSFIKKIKLLFSNKITGNKLMTKLSIKFLILINRL